MKIISELVSSTVKNRKKDSFATRVSIFLAVILLGSIIFDISFMKQDYYNQTVSRVGDYHVSLSEIDEQKYNLLKSNKNIERISFDKAVETNLKGIIYEKGDYYWNLKSFQPSSGRKPSKHGELMVTERFLNRNKDLAVGSQIKVKDENYTIVGTYDDYGYTFEESVLIGYLGDYKKETLFNENNTGVIAFIWYKNPRDTYTNTKQILREMGIDFKKAENTGRLFFNKDILEYKMIYPAGIIPPSNVIAEAVETYGPLFILSLVFVVIIYGAFNVWNDRDIREIALLKSVGMTEKQVKKMIRLKALRLSVVPVILGTISAYFVANLLIYLIWLNNFVSYSKMSDIWGENLRSQDFKMINISILSILIIMFFSFTTVYLSAIVPAGKSAKQNIIEGLKGISDNKFKQGKSSVHGRVERGLAKDYFRAYNSTYRNIILAMLLSSMVMTFVLVSQSYRVVNSVYGKYDSPYNFTSHIYTESDIDRQMADDLQKVKGIDEIYLYSNKSFKFYFEDNTGFESDELKAVFERGTKVKEDVYANIIGLSSDDFDHVLLKNKLDSSLNYIILNKTPDNNKSPYSFRNYIKLTDENEKDIVVRYNEDGNKMPIHIDGYINDFPFDLEGQTQNGIYIFTKMENLEKFIEKYGQDESDPVNYYTVQIKADENLEEISDKCERIISSYIPKNDHSTISDIIKSALDKEQLRNEHTLNFGVQIILVIIALSNAYNSFYGNLRARKREFQILFTLGMTEKQIKKMIYEESIILFRNVSVLYILIFISAVLIRSYKTGYEPMFISKEILMNLNYIPIVIIFAVMISGVLIAIRSSIRTILIDDLNNAVREI